MKVKQIACLLAFVMLLGMLGGCSNNHSEESVATQSTTMPQDQSTKATEETGALDPTEEGVAEDSLPTEPLETEPTEDTVISTEPDDTDEPLPDDSDEPTPNDPDVPATSCSVVIGYAFEEQFQQHDKYVVYPGSDAEFYCDIMITPSTEVSNFTLFLLDADKLFNENVYEITEILFSCDTLSPDKPFVTRKENDGPEYGISYIDASGQQHRYLLVENFSGEGMPYNVSAF